MIPFFSFEHMNRTLGQRPHEAFRDFWEKKWYILGQSVTDFEEKYAAWNGTHHAIGVANGLDALVLSLRALGIGAGDEVIVPSNTYIATWLAVSHVGARPIAVEPSLKTLNIDTNLIENSITKRTRAILPVHLYGRACDMKTILEIAEKHRLFVVEDNAQAHGAAQNGRLTGAFGHVNATSFYPTKNLGAAGDAGAVTTDDDDLARKIRQLRNYGSEQKYFNEIIGFNSRLDEFQAALLTLKLPFLQEWTIERQSIASIYYHELSDLPDLILPEKPTAENHVFHLFVVQTSHRDALAEHLKNLEIGTMIHYPVPPHLQRAYQFLGHRRGDFPLAEAIAERCLSLPLFPGMTVEQVHEVCAAIKSWIF